jgi:hypothetical protein
MSLLGSAFFASVIMCLIANALGFTDLKSIFTGTFALACLAGLPIAILNAVIHGAVDRAEDRKDQRAEAYKRRWHSKRAGATIVDARTVIQDHRSITLLGRVPKEDQYGRKEGCCADGECGEPTETQEDR